jgi:predicted dehydrogenase
MNRRDFLKTSIVSSAGAAILNTRVFAGAAEQPLRVGLIGCGWYGKTDLLHLIQVAPVEVVGLCDVDQRMLAQAADLVTQRQRSQKRPPTYRDYRKLLAEQRPEVVLIATPDHWHCLPVVEACKNGADVYVQKPICYDVMEGQAMVAAARKYGRTVQVGLQRRSTPHLLEARDQIIRSGKLGTIGRVEIHSYFGGPSEFPPDSEPPAHLDWDLYIGPAKWRNYNPAIHPRLWRNCREFSNGQTGDLCVHFLDVVRYFLDLGWPRQITASGGILMRRPTSGLNTHDTQIAIFDYGHLQIVWNQRNWGLNPDPNFTWGATLYGDKGMLKLSVLGYDYVPYGNGAPIHRDFVDERDKYPGDTQHEEIEVFAAPATRQHLREFLAARETGKMPVADIEQGYISSACCILANISMELGRGLIWDAASGRVLKDDEANQMLAREYRGDWIHPTPENV